MGDLDIAVAGCGIAGAGDSTAAQSARPPRHAYERFEVPRPIGWGLMIQPSRLAVLVDLGLAGEVIAHGAPIARLYGRAG